MVSQNTKSLQQGDNMFFHPWEGVELYGNNARTILTEGEGVYVRDSEGNRMIDGPGGMWCVNVGHGNAEMAEAIKQQALALPYASSFSMGNVPASLLADKLAALAPGDLNNVFFTTCGSTAVDSALRLVAFRNNYIGRSEKKYLLSRVNAYHGSTFLSASVSGKGRDKNYHDFYSENVHFVSSPKRCSDDAGMSDDEYNKLKADELEAAICRIGADKVAAFIAEPVMGSGGVIIPPSGYFLACLEVCRRHEVVFIADETVTAFGRLGYFFSCEDVFDVVPDIITCAKGLTSGYVPMGATIISDRIMNSMRDAVNEDGIFANGYTYSGHPLAAAAALKNIEIMERDGFMEHVRDVGRYFEERIKTLEDLEIVDSTRAIGLMGCVECRPLSGMEHSLSVDYSIGTRVDRHCQELGLLVRPLINMCVMSPPLIITRAQIDDMLNILREGLRRTEEELKKEINL